MTTTGSSLSLSSTPTLETAPLHSYLLVKDTSLFSREIEILIWSYTFSQEELEIMRDRKIQILYAPKVSPEIVAKWVSWIKRPDSVAAPTQGVHKVRLHQLPETAARFAGHLLAKLGAVYRASSLTSLPLGLSLASSSPTSIPMALRIDPTGLVMTHHEPTEK